MEVYSRKLFAIFGYSRQTYSSLEDELGWQKCSDVPMAVIGSASKLEDVKLKIELVLVTIGFHFAFNVLKTTKDINCGIRVR